MPTDTSSPSPDPAQSRNENCNPSESNGSVYPPLAQFVANIRVAVSSNQKTNVSFNIRQTVIGEHFSRLTVTGQFASLEGSEQAAIISLTSAIDLDCFTVDGHPWVIAGRDDIKHVSGWGLVSSWRGLRGLQKRNLIRLLSQDFGANGRNKWELLPPLPVIGFEPRCTFWKWRCTTSARQPLSGIELGEIEQVKTALILETARAGEAPERDELNEARAGGALGNDEKSEARAGETGLLPNTTVEARAGETGLLPNTNLIGPSPCVSNELNQENGAVHPARAVDNGTENATSLSLSLSKLASYLSENKFKGIRKWKVEWLVKQAGFTLSKLDRALQAINEKGDKVEKFEGLLVYLVLHAETISTEMTAQELQRAALPESVQEDDARGRIEVAAATTTMAKQWAWYDQLSDKEFQELYNQMLGDRPDYKFLMRNRANSKAFICSHFASLAGGVP